MVVVHDNQKNKESKERSKASAQEFSYKTVVDNRRAWEKNKKSKGIGKSWAINAKWMKVWGTFQLAVGVLLPILFWTAYLGPIIEDEGSIAPTMVALYVFFVISGIYSFSIGLYTVVSGFRWNEARFLTKQNWFLWFAVVNGAMGAFPLMMHYIFNWRASKRRNKILETRLQQYGGNFN